MELLAWEVRLPNAVTWGLLIIRPPNYSFGDLSTMLIIGPPNYSFDDTITMSFTTLLSAKITEW